MGHKELPDNEARCGVDLDGVLTLGPGKGPFDFAPVRTGAREFLRELHERYQEVYIHTARDVSAAKNWMRQNGLLKYVVGVTNTKLPAKVTVDDRVVRFEGDFKAALAEMKDFRPYWQEESNVGHERSSTQVDLPAGVAEQVRALADKVADSDLHEKGREERPHITILYGITTDDAGMIREAAKGFGMVTARLGVTSLFEVPEKGFDVLKVEVRSPDLRRLRKKIEAATEFESDFPGYQPHATVAYLKHGAGKKYTGDRTLLGVNLEFPSFLFISRADDNTTLSLL